MYRANKMLKINFFSQNPCEAHEYTSSCFQIIKVFKKSHITINSSSSVGNVIISSKVTKVGQTLANAAPIEQCIDFNQRTSMEKPLLIDSYCSCHLCRLIQKLV